jgi:hypothetical protein
VKNYIHVLIVILVLSSCHLLAPYHIWIDNPSNASFTVIIDNHSYQIKAMGSTEILLSKGKYIIKILKDSISKQSIRTETLVIREDGIINICNAEYVFIQQVYGKSTNTTAASTQNNEVVLNNYTYHGQIQKIGKDQIFIPKTWNLGLNEKFRISENILGKQKVISKIFRCNEFETDFLKNAR